jgi:hypothetical protein
MFCDRARQCSEFSEDDRRKCSIPTRLYVAYSLDWLISEVLPALPANKDIQKLSLKTKAWVEQIEYRCCHSRSTKNEVT